MQFESKSPRAASPRADLASLMVMPVLAERTLTLADGQTKLSLETMVWEGLEEAARCQGKHAAELCGELESVKPAGVDLATAIRTFVLTYYREAESA